MVWVDLEMTGLNLEVEEIMEMACIITDKDLNIVAEADDIIIKVFSAIGNVWLVRIKMFLAIVSQKRKNNSSVFSFVIDSRYRTRN